MLGSGFEDVDSFCFFGGGAVGIVEFVRVPGDKFLALCFSAKRFENRGLNVVDMLSEG